MWLFKRPTSLQYAEKVGREQEQRQVNQVQELGGPSLERGQTGGEGRLDQDGEGKGVKCVVLGDTLGVKC